MKEENKETVKKKERAFQEALREYRASGSKEAWDSVFFLVFDACKNIAKSKANGIVINDLEEKALNAACKVCKNIKEGVNPKKLSSYCYLFTIGEIWSKKAIRWERSVFFDGLFDNYASVTDEDGFISICTSAYGMEYNY